MSRTLPKAISAYVDATNAHNIEAPMATFTDDALDNDVSREFWGSDKIRRWIEREITGAKVTMDVVEVIEQHGDITCARRLTANSTRLACLTRWSSRPIFSIDNGKICQLIITNNKPAP